MKEDINNILKDLLYEENKSVILEKLSEITSTEVLYNYTYNYNWDDGFECPSVILNNKNCDMSTALLMFYDVGGQSILMNNESFKYREMDEWKSFLDNLFKRLLNSDFLNATIKYKPELSKVAIYKIKKSNPELPSFFVNGFEGKDIDLIII